MTDYTPWSKVSSGVWERRPVGSGLVLQVRMLVSGYFRICFVTDQGVMETQSVFGSLEAARDHVDALLQGQEDPDPHRDIEEYWDDPVGDHDS